MELHCASDRDFDVIRIGSETEDGGDAGEADYDEGDLSDGRRFSGALGVSETYRR